MIYYFSGTGNSLFVAKKAGEALSSPIRDIQSIERGEIEVSHSSIGIIFPVYAWGVPRNVKDFIKLLAKNQAINANTYLWAIMTCGDDTGYADRILDKCLRGCEKKCFDAVYSVHMPNTYVCLPSFEVDAPNLAQKKISQTMASLPHIMHSIQHRVVERKLVRGDAPRIKTYILRPLFNQFLLTDKYFHTQKERCTQCGVCQKQCPTHNIRLTQGGVEWEQTNCIGCLRCFHHCPQRAIDWGRFTLGKKQKSAIQE